ncbi:hypothetical protein EMCRGX_G007210 [Ephydatia muelleri]
MSAGAKRKDHNCKENKDAEKCPVVHNLQLSTQYSFVEAACTTAGCQTGGVANVTTLDSAPVGQAPSSSSIPIPLPCSSNGMLPSNPTMSSLPTPCTIESPALSRSQRCGHLLRQPQSSSIPTTPAAFSNYQINSLMTDFLWVKLHGGLPWLMFAQCGLWTSCRWIQQYQNLQRCTDRFDAVSVQNVGSTYIIVSWDMPTDSNGILINFSLYCNGALASVLPLTVISYNTTGLLPFTLYMYITLSVGQVLQSHPQALHSSWNMVLGVSSAAASLPRTILLTRERTGSHDFMAVADTAEPMSESASIIRTDSIPWHGNTAEPMSESASIIRTASPGTGTLLSPCLKVPPSSGQYPLAREHC